MIKNELQIKSLPFFKMKFPNAIYCNILSNSILFSASSVHYRIKKLTVAYNQIFSSRVENIHIIYQIKRIIFQNMNLTCFTGRIPSVPFFSSSKVHDSSRFLSLQLICFPMMIDEGVKRWNFFFVAHAISKQSLKRFSF